MQNKSLTTLKAYRFRILSGILFCTFLISTWFLFYQKPEYPEEIHIGLQEQLKAIIRDTLSQKNPQADNLKFQKMWTQATNKKNQISAHFQYSFDDESQTNISIEGHAIMNRKDLESSEKYDLWSLDHVEINNTKLEFQEPITLLSSKINKKKDPSAEEKNTLSKEEINKQETSKQKQDISKEVTIEEPEQPKIPEKKQETHEEKKSEQE